MNRPLRRIALALMLMFGLLLGNLNYLQAIEAPSLNARPGNSRIVLREYSHRRGDILVAGRPIATSVATKDDLKYLRRYSAPELYAAVTGFSSLVYGRTGIERAEQSVLAGTDDRLFIRRTIDTLSGRDLQGGSVQLTLDAAAQKAAYDGLKALGNARGAVVAIQPRTGRILALVSSPSFDPGVLSTHDPKAITAAYAKLVADPGQPLQARPLAHTYPPGSTFKLVTLAAALSSGRYTPDTAVPGPARLSLPGSSATLPNFDNRPCSPTGGSRSAVATTTLREALRRSCNTTFAAVGLALGGDALRAQAQKFGFDRSDLAVPLDVATSRFPRTLDRPQTAQSAVGQFDVAATPLQMAMVAAGIANRGVVMRPYLVDRVLGPDLTPIDSADHSAVLSTAVSPLVAQQITQIMVDVVATGTGRNAAIEGVKVAGKTGTAQQGPAKPPHAWFVSFAPSDDPQVAVAVVIEDGGGVQRDEISGGGLAAPIAKRVMQAVLRK